MTCESCIPLLKENIALKKEHEELKKRIEELESQIKEIRSYIWKPQKQESEPKKFGPPEDHKPNNRPVPKDIHRRAKLGLTHCPECNSDITVLYTPDHAGI
ncbi:MAG: hypothetical protein HYX24_00985 [Candidatus Aenigmarchaeota archaeon]|nr:hypothetical protein [Candidatus Aenigmarchaeota archaeon]